MPQAGASVRVRSERPEEAWFDWSSIEDEDELVDLEPPHLTLAPARAPAPPDRPANAEAPARRTVVITGRGSDRYRPPARTQTSPYAAPAAARRRSQRPRHERAGFRPDRAGMWAVLLCLVLLLVAATSSHAAMLGHALAH